MEGKALMSEDETVQAILKADADYSLADYQADAKSTMGFRKLDDFNLTVGAMGISTASGAVSDCIQKVVSHGQPFDPAKLMNELGDLMWYISMLSTLMEVPLDEIARQNIEKIREMYPKPRRKQVTVPAEEES